MQSIRHWLLGGIVCALLATVSGVLYLRRNPKLQDHVAPNADAPGAAASAPGEILSVEKAAFGHERWYVTDTRGHRLHMLDSAGHIMRSIGRRGRGPGEFTVPHQVAVGMTKIYVSELGRPAISVFDSTGRFLRYLRTRGSCPAARVDAMSAQGSDLYVLRRCMEPDRVRFQIERSLSDGPLEVWPAVADTTPIPKGGPLPLNMPLFGVFGRRLVLGDANEGCFRIVRLPDGQPTGRRCLHELERRAMPRDKWERLARRARGRIAIPDSLPRVVNLMLLDSTILVQAVESFDTSRWLEVSFEPQKRSKVRQLGSASAAQSFVNGRVRLMAWDEPNGIRIEVVPIER